MQQFLAPSVQEIDFYTHCCSLVATKTRANGLYLPVVMSVLDGRQGAEGMRAGAEEWGGTGGGAAAGRRGETGWPTLSRCR